MKKLGNSKIEVVRGMAAATLPGAPGEDRAAHRSSSQVHGKGIQTWA